MAELRIDFDCNFVLDSIGIELPDEIEVDGSWAETDKHDMALCRKLENAHFMHKLTSEKQLEALAERELQQGASYHFLSNGKINSSNFLQFILKQQSLEHLLLTTWAITMPDIEEMERLVDSGRIKKVDFYLGDIFIKKRRNLYEALAEVARKSGGKAIIFKTHSKVMVGFGEKYDFVLESSANIGAASRRENTCLTLDTELAQCYKEWFESKKSLIEDDTE